MKRYWYVLIEQYESGAVKAAVLKNQMAESQPADFYKQEYGREIYGEWFDSETEALEAVSSARALNAALVSGRSAA